jgi:branched-chain amino acid transport system permease protein
MSQSASYFIEFAIVYMLMAWGVYLPLKAGLLFAGPIYSMAIGGYLAAYLVIGLGWPFLLALVVAILAGALVGFLPAIGLARTVGITTAMASIALVFIIQAVFKSMSWLGGTNGYRITEYPSYLNVVSWVSVVVVGWLLWRVERSRLGRAMEAIMVDRHLALSMGINVTTISVFALTASCAIGALAGAIFVFNIGRIYPDSFGFTLALYANTIVFVGGRYTVWGAMVAAPILFGLPQWLPHSIAPYSNVLYGVVLVGILILRPEGIITKRLVERVSALFRRLEARPRRNETVPGERG